MEFFLFFFVGFVAGLIIDKYLPSYFKEKGKNLATKEDIEEITHKVESVRIALNSRFQISQFRYEKEYEILTDLSSKAINFRDAAKNLRPIVDTSNQNQTEEERKKERLGCFHEAMRAMYEATEKRRPFFPHQIYELCLKLDQLCWHEATSYNIYSQSSDLSYWDKAEKNSKDISELADELVNTIRKRVQEWESLDLSK